MRQVLEIIKQDFRNLKRVPLVALLLIGLAFLPALYAWFNIAASWDPYSNTEGIKVAIVNEDEGATVDHDAINVGDELVDNLADNNQMGWVFVDRDQAEQGVRNGDYYASVYIEPQFSAQLTSVIDGDPEAPEVHYEVNEKMNAIAPKMTSAGASAVVDEISQQFLEEASRSLFSQLNDIGIELENELPTIRRIETLIFELEDRFPEINDVGSKVVALQNDWPELREKLDRFLAVEDEFDTINEGADVIVQMEGYLPTVHQVSDRLVEVERVLPEIEEIVAQANEVDGRLDEIEQQLTNTLELLQTAEDALVRAEEALPTVTQISGNMEQYTQQMNEVLSQLEQAVDPFIEVVNTQAQIIDQATDLILTALAQAESGEGIDNAIEQLEQANRLLVSNQEALTNAISFLEQLQMGTSSNEMDAFVQTLHALNEQVNQLQSVVSEGIETLKSTSELDSSQLDSIRSQVTSVQEHAQMAQSLFNDESKTTIKTGITHLQDDVNSVGATIREQEERLPEIEALLNRADDVRASGEAQIETLLAELPGVRAQLQEGLAFIETELPRMKELIHNVNEFFANDFPGIEDQIHQAADFVREDLPTIENELSSVIDVIETNLPQFEETLAELAQFSNEQLPDLEESVGTAADRIREFDENHDLNDMISLLRNDIEEESAFFREPVQLVENQLYPIPNYGSANAPFYTALSLWVGSLLLVNLLKTDVHPKDMREDYRYHHIYLGRLVLFLLVSLLQGIIVSVGNLFLLGTYAAHPVYFILFTILTGFVFMTIVYTLASVFGNIGKALAIVLMVLQLSGAGGTFPIQVAPPFFQAINPFLPFTYAINLLREAVAGMVWPTVWSMIGLLILIFVLALAFGLLLKKPLAKRMEATATKSKSSRMID
ncbi:YhgE/Pip domain-containing protein [Bacillus sp. Marseille-P3800]|uniref:YhgE/Pip domain-containing protein n=1 Tax=Bacillus sp. Marseille-P3800 TaxID=2014782 RepID=UPI000C0809D1|nr:YhgE/Pip domain-containing protein [Bacillus sp. Marseille-P3800]